MPWPRYFDLLLHTPGALVKVSGIAERQQTPPKFLESILAELGNAVLWPPAGCRRRIPALARPADSITLGEVLACLGEQRKTEC